MFTLFGYFQIAFIAIYLEIEINNWLDICTFHRYTDMMNM
jgi:hypothetical protein